MSSDLRFNEIRITKEEGQQVVEKVEVLKNQLAEEFMIATGVILGPREYLAVKVQLYCTRGFQAEPQDDVEREVDQINELPVKVKSTPGIELEIDRLEAARRMHQLEVKLK